MTKRSAGKYEHLLTTATLILDMATKGLPGNTPEGSSINTANSQHRPFSMTVTVGTESSGGHGRQRNNSQEQPLGPADSNPSCTSARQHSIPRPHAPRQKMGKMPLWRVALPFQV
ncbi:unnamed protein product [Boreogadus saida]